MGWCYWLVMPLLVAPGPGAHQVTEARIALMSLRLCRHPDGDAAAARVCCTFISLCMLQHLRTHIMLHMTCDLLPYFV